MYGFTDAIVGTFDLIRNVGMISNSDATTTATTVNTVKSNGARSQPRCQPADVNVAHAPAGRGCADGPSTYLPRNGAASITGTSYLAGRCFHVMMMFQPNINVPVRYIKPPTTRIQYIGISLTTVSMKSGYAKRPVSSNARHISPCVTPAL